MRCLAPVAFLCVFTPFLLCGCVGEFAENQARRQAARTADHYIHQYAEPEINDYADNDPAFQHDMRQVRNDVADTIVRTGNPRQQTPVGVDDRGWLTDGHYNNY